MYGLSQSNLLAQRSLELQTMLLAIPFGLHQKVDPKVEQEFGAKHP